MRSLFFRLFLGFLLTIFLGGAVSGVVISTSQHLSIELFKNDMMRKLDENAARLIVLSGQAAREMYRCGGQAEYENYLNGLVEGARTRITLIRDDNRTLTGDKISDEFVFLAESARKQTEAALKKSGETLMVAKHLTTRDGDSFVVLGEHTFGGPPGFQPPMEGKGRSFFAGIFPPFFARGEMIRLTIMIVAISGFCYVLARSLTIPIRRLQKTTQQIAGGDYSVRVGKSLGKTGNEIADLGRDFDIMVDRTEKVISAQKRLLRDISHELRSPLARMGVALELAKSRLHAEDSSSLKKIELESGRLNELIGQLLTLTRLESGVGLAAVEPVDLTRLLADVVADVDYEAANSSRGVKIVATAEVMMSGSRELLRRAIENIIRNAAQYTADKTQVEVTLSVGHDEAQIQVTDFGPGVPEHDLPHLLEPFYRVAEARERQTGGVGIGLAIAEQAVKAHGGRVIMENCGGGRGLVVTIALPLSA